MRGRIEGLSSPHPLGLALPVVLQSEPATEPSETTGAGLQPPQGTYTTTILPTPPSSSPQETLPQRGLLGEWILRLEDGVNPGEQALTLMRGGERVTTGAVTYAAELATFVTADCRAAEGKYRWSFDGASLSLVVVEDDCEPRQRLLTAQPWSRRNFALRFMSAFDDGLAPAQATLDNLDAYFDARLAPADFVDWLSSWVGLTANQRWPLRRRRDRIARAVGLYRSWGTRAGIVEVVAITAGVAEESVEIVENGGVASSPTPGGELPGKPDPQMTVRVKVPDPAQADVELLQQVVKAARPAHLVVELEVVGA
jgi:phage tail-like protein